MDYDYQYLHEASSCWVNIGHGRLEALYGVKYRALIPGTSRVVWIMNK
jgi:hypothetical protein